MFNTISKLLFMLKFMHFSLSEWDIWKEYRILVHNLVWESCVTVSNYFFIWRKGLRSESIFLISNTCTESLNILKLYVDWNIEIHALFIVRYFERRKKFITLYEKVVLQLVIFLYLMERTKELHVIDIYFISI